MNFPNSLPLLIITRCFGTTVPVLLVCTLLGLFYSRASAQKPPTTKFRVAVVKIDITPDDSQNLLGYGARKSVGILDSIYHRIMVLDDGTTQFFLMSSDICEFSPSE